MSFKKKTVLAKLGGGQKKKRMDNLLYYQPPWIQNPNKTSVLNLLDREIVNQTSMQWHCKLILFICDQSIESTKTKYIKLNTKTQIFFKITFNFCIHFKRENFFFSKCVKKSSNFHLNNKKY